MSVILGLIAAIGWGIVDYLMTCLARIVGTAKAMIVTQGMSLVVIAVLIAVLQGGVPPHSHAWMLLILCGLCDVVGMLMSYRAFEIGTLSIVSPIVSGFAVVTALLAYATGERHAAVVIVGAGVLLAGIIFVTRAPSDEKSNATLRGLPEALISTAGFGTAFYLLGRITPTLGDYWPITVLRSMGIVSAGIALMIGAKGWTAPPGKISWRTVLPVAAGVAAADTAATLAFNGGVSIPGATTVVTALASLFSAVAVVLACLFLKERLSRGQWVGIGIVLVGVLMVSIPPTPDRTHFANANAPGQHRTMLPGVTSRFVGGFAAVK